LDIKIQNLNLNLEIAEVNNEISVKLALEAKFPNEKINKKCNSDYVSTTQASSVINYGNKNLEYYNFFIEYYV
jgi:hypothetical protein